MLVVAGLGWGCKPATPIESCGPATRQSVVIDLPAVRRVELGFGSAGATRFSPALRSEQDRIALRMEGSDAAALVLVPFEVCAADDSRCGSIDRAWLASANPGARSPSGALLLAEFGADRTLSLHGPLPAGRLVLVRATSEPARLHIESTVACALESSTAIAWPSEPRCGDGWVEGDEACDSGDRQSAGCRACVVSPPQCSNDGALVLTRCAGEPSRCIEHAIDPMTAPAVEVEIRLLAQGRAGPGSPALEVVSPHGPCRCRITEYGESCDAGCAFERAACSAVRIEPRPELGQWNGCELDAEGCAVQPSPADSRVTASEDLGLPSSRVLARSDVRPRAVVTDLAPDGGVVAHSLVGRSVVAPSDGALVFRHATAITRMGGDGRVLWERGFGGTAGHVRPAAVALGPHGTAVFVGTFPAPERRRGADGRPRPEVPRLVALDHEGRQAWMRPLPYVDEAVASIGDDGTVAVAIARRAPRRGASLLTLDERGRVLVTQRLPPDAELLAVRAASGGVAELLWAEPRSGAALTVVRGRVEPSQPVRRVASSRLPGVSTSDISAMFDGDTAWLASGTADAIELTRLGPGSSDARVRIGAIDRCGRPILGRSPAGLLLGTASCTVTDDDGLVVFSMDTEGRVVGRDRLAVAQGTARLEGLASTGDETWLVVRVAGAGRLAEHTIEPTGGQLWLALPR